MKSAIPSPAAWLLLAAACSPPVAPREGDSLTTAEISAIADSLRAGGLLDDGIVVTWLSLREPGKTPTGSPEAPSGGREAMVQLFDRHHGVRRDLTLALPGMQIVSERADTGIPPRLTQADFRDAARLIGGDSAWQAGLRRRGLEAGDVVISGMGPGVLGADWEEPGHRYVRVLARLRAAPGMDQPPVEGLVGVVDLTEGAVVRVEDAEPVPPPLDRRPVAIFPEQPTLPRPLRIQQRGRNYQLDGSRVRWAGWEFRFAMDPREGLVLHDIGFGPSTAPARRILTRASLSEMLVPYGDPSGAWTFRSVFDAGEFGLGLTAVTLVPGQDVPENADRFDAVVAREDGSPRTLPGVIGLYERDGGLRWRHLDRARRGRELVVRSAVNVGNYDYGFSWVFSEDGVLAMEIDLTGRLMVKGVAGPDPRFGALVAPRLSGIVHQHFFNFRLDFDLDGRRNRVREVEMQVAPADSANRFGTAFGVRSTVLAREGTAMRNVAPERSRTWVIENTGTRDSLGQAAGYVLIPGPLPSLLTGEEALLRRRATFATHALWVTAWNASERYAAGEAPGQDPGGAGLPTFVADDEPVEDADLVVWYTTGISHLPRPEEWPVMPVSRIRFELRPRHFLTVTPDAGARP